MLAKEIPRSHKIQDFLVDKQKASIKNLEQSDEDFLYEGFSVSNSVNVRMCEVISLVFKLQKRYMSRIIHCCMLHEKFLSFMQ